jgi:ParB family chromosome partitioning protein
MSEKRRLGRGLDALLGGSAVAERETGSPNPGATVQIPLDKIETNPHQPRRDFDPEELSALKESLATHGLLQPVVVRAAGTGYQLIAGERRLRAAREVGWTEIPVHIVDYNDQQVFEAALVENIQRSDLNPIEKAQGFQAYLQQFNVTHEELAKKIGLDRSTISNLLRLLELPPPVQEAVRTGQISNGHARALLALDDPARQTAVCQEIIAKGLSVRAVESLAKNDKSEKPIPTSSAPDTQKTAHVTSIEDELRQLFATRVEIRLAAEERGQIVVSFEDNAEFERLLAMLRRLG